MAAMIEYLQGSFGLFILLGAASACLVFGLAAIFEPIRETDASLRRANAMQWAVTGVSDALVPKKEHERTALRLSLLQAGYEAPNATQVYYGVRVLCAVGFACAVMFGWPLFAGPQKLALMASLIAAIVGFLIPVYFVRARRQSRQQQFRDGLPDVLELLLVCSEAGLGIDTALLRVSEEVAQPHPLLARELRIVSAELRAGLVRADAMQGLSNRTGIDEIVSLVNLLIQSDALGTSMAATLRGFAQDMRAHRMLRAEELGHKVGVKLTMVLVACFLPAMFAAALAPAVYTAVQKFQGLSLVMPLH